MKTALFQLALVIPVMIGGYGIAHAQNDVAALQAQQAYLSNLLSVIPDPSTFTRDLSYGSSGPDVKGLQELLGFAGEVIPAGPTGYFGAQTQAALASYQRKNGIKPASGYFGPITRAQMGIE